MTIYLVNLVIYFVEGYMLCVIMCVCIECGPFGFKDTWLYGHSNMLFSIYIINHK